MASMLPGDSSHHGVLEGLSSKQSEDMLEDGARWYFSRKEIEENSPSKEDGIDLKKESYLRKSYCTFLQDLGMRLKVPQVTIATAIIFCHRFFLRQSHAKNDRRTIATVCMFLAGKVEETPRPLKDVILVSYEIIHKKDPAAVQKIKQKEVYEQQKELILLGERVVLATLGFDLNVHHPYKPLVEAIKKFKVAQNALAQVAWNFVNDGLRTSLCLQFKPHHIAAGAIFLAAKFLKVKLPSDGEKVWWQEFDVTPRQLEEVSNQMLELYEQNRVPPSSEADGSAGAGASNRTSIKDPTSSEEHVANNHSQGGGSSSRPGSLKPLSSRQTSEQSRKDFHGEPPKTNQSQSSENGSIEMRSSLTYKEDSEYELNQHLHPERERFHQDNLENAQNLSKFRSENLAEQDQESKVTLSLSETRVVESKDKHVVQEVSEGGTYGWPHQDVIKKIDRDKVKAALEKRRKSLGSMTRKTELMDDDDLIERELEAGIEMAAESEKNKQDGRQRWSKSSNSPERENLHEEKHQEHENLYEERQQEEYDRDERHQGITGQSFNGQDLNNMEEGELSTVNDAGLGYQSPRSSNRKRKARSPSDQLSQGKQWHDYVGGSHHDIHSDYVGDGNGEGVVGHGERDRRRHLQENRV